MLPKPMKTGGSPAARDSLRSAGGSQAGLSSNQKPVWQVLSGQSPGGGVTNGLVASSVGTVWSILKNFSAPVRGEFICSRRWLPVVVHVEASAARAARPTHLFNLLLPCGRTATVALGPEAVGSTGAISTPTAWHPHASCNATASSIDNTPATTRSPGSTAASSAAAICGAIPATQALMAREQDHSPPAILRADPETASRASSSLLSIGASASPASSTSGAKSRSATTALAYLRPSVLCPGRSSARRHRVTLEPARRVLGTTETYTTIAVVF